jgi:hypothetical protein
MVAPRAYLDRAEVRRRTSLKISPPPEPERIRVPENVRGLVDAIYDEIEARTLKPVLEASTLEEADARAIEGFGIFCDLWPAALGALIPWLMEDPEQIARWTGAARDLWRSDEAIQKLGENVCEWFAAAQSARQALANVSLAGIDLDELTKHVLLADYAHMLGALLVRASNARSAEGLALVVAKLAHTAATNAFAIATVHRYADETP